MRHITFCPLFASRVIMCFFALALLSLTSGCSSLSTLSLPVNFASNNSLHGGYNLSAPLPGTESDSPTFVSLNVDRNRDMVGQIGWKLGF